MDVDQVRSDDDDPGYEEFAKQTAAKLEALQRRDGGDARILELEKQSLKRWRQGSSKGSSPINGAKNPAIGKANARSSRK